MADTQVQPVELAPRAAGSRWPRVCLSSFVLATITGLVLWVAIVTLLGQGQLETVLSAGRGELAAPLLIVLVVATGMCERMWPASAARCWRAATSRTRCTWPCTPSR